MRDIFAGEVPSYGAWDNFETYKDENGYSYSEVWLVYKFAGHLQSELRAAVGSQPCPLSRREYHRFSSEYQGWSFSQDCCKTTQPLRTTSFYTGLALSIYPARLLKEIEGSGRTLSNVTRFTCEQWRIQELEESQRIGSERDSKETQLQWYDLE